MTPLAVSPTTSTPLPEKTPEANEGAHSKCHDLGLITLTQGGLFQCRLEYDVGAQKLASRWLFRVPLKNVHGRLNQVMKQHFAATVTGDNVLTINISLASCRIKTLSYDVSKKELRTDFSYDLTYYDLRRLNQYGDQELPILTKRASCKETPAFAADLHTHFGGALSDAMIEKAIFESKEPVLYPVSNLKEMGVVYSGTVDANNMIDLRDPNTQFSREKFLRSQIMDPLGVSSFLDMELVYRLRGPIVKNLKLFPVFLELLAQDYQKHGVKHVELSISDIVKPEWMNAAVKILPELEKKYGVRILFSSSPVEALSQKI